MDSTSLRLDWMRSFACFARCLSFTEAARQLHISQPALHTQIKRLTETVGQPLYTRTGRRLSLTDTGREVETLAQDLLGRIETFAASQSARTPVVSAGRALHLHVLAEPLRDWGAPVELRIERREDSLDSVRRGLASLAVVPLTEAVPDLEVLPFRTIPALALLPAGHPLSGRSDLRLADLAGQPLVVPPSGRPHREDLSRRLGPGLVAAVEVDGWDLQAHYAMLGAGIAVVNGYVPVPDGLIAKPLSDLPPLQLSVVHRPSAARGTARLCAHLLA